MQLKHHSWKQEYADDINRFVKAHEQMYDTALSELTDGRKESHWMWYTFPQLRGLGRTYNADYYGISDLTEAEAYLENDLLNDHMRTLLSILLDSDECDATWIFGYLDALKLRSSMTLFDAVSPDDIFSDVLQKFFDGQRDEKTLAMLDL